MRGRYLGRTQLITIQLGRVLRLTCRVSSARYFALLPYLEATERELLADRARHAAAVAAAKSRPADIRAEWDGYPLVRQRAVVEEHLSAVVIHKATRKGAQFDPDLLELVWTD